MWGGLTHTADDASVHLQDWPAVPADAQAPDLEEQMALARHLVSLGRAARAQAGVKVRQPLRRALVALPPDAPALLADLVAEELNVDEVVVVDRLSEVLSFELVPNFRLLGPRLGVSVQPLRTALAEADVHAIVDALEAGRTARVELPGGPVELGAEEVEVRVRGREGFGVSREGTAAVALDLEVDDELRRRGLLRDVIRQVQSLRRSARLEMSDRIELWLNGLDELESDAGLIGREVLAVRVHFGPGSGPETPLELDDARPATARLERVGLD
jgi:isoleucyl-tRNA synthetase